MVQAANRREVRRPPAESQGAGAGVFLTFFKWLSTQNSSIAVLERGSVVAEGGWEGGCGCYQGRDVSGGRDREGEEARGREGHRLVENVRGGILHPQNDSLESYTKPKSSTLIKLKRKERYVINPRPEVSL